MSETSQKFLRHDNANNDDAKDNDDGNSDDNVDNPYQYGDRLSAGADGNYSPGVRCQVRRWKLEQYKPQEGQAKSRPLEYL